MNSLESLKLYYLEHRELLIRTDCQAIISFFNKSSFVDFITGLGIDVFFDHIDGKDNILADALSLTVLCNHAEEVTKENQHLINLFANFVQEWQDKPAASQACRIQHLSPCS
ncbi:hypothetical protein EJ110_NYTH34858 [Nymphaea thermarum]|nr:hypothetical protein EJ110_NYTH34858 [Nymphaea thermarum]